MEHGRTQSQLSCQHTCEERWCPGRDGPQCPENRGKSWDDRSSVPLPSATEKGGVAGTHRTTLRSEDFPSRLHLGFAHPSSLEAEYPHLARSWLFTPAIATATHDPIRAACYRFPLFTTRKRASKSSSVFGFRSLVVSRDWPRAIPISFANSCAAASVISRLPTVDRSTDDQLTTVASHHRLSHVRWLLPRQPLLARARSRAPTGRA